MRALWQVLIGLAVLCLACGSACADKRVALVIGNSAYQKVESLSNPTNDAQAVADLFRSAVFDVVDTYRDLGINELRRVVREFADVARDADIAVVFYAGHGIEVDGNNYLIPIDAKLKSDLDVEDETVSIDRLLRVIDPAKRLRLVILDACRDNPFVKTMKRSIGARGVGRGLAQVEPSTSDTLIAFAAKAGSIAIDVAGGKNSPFTAALVKHIAEPGLDLRIALGRVRDEVLKTTGRRQEPFVYGSLGGTTVSLVPAPMTVVIPPITSTSDERRDYELAAHASTQKAWDAFLARYKTGFYTDLAREERAKFIDPAQAKSESPKLEPSKETGPTVAVVQPLSPNRERLPGSPAAIVGPPVATSPSGESTNPSVAALPQPAPPPSKPNDTS
jgi:Caspase domain